MIAMILVFFCVSFVGVFAQNNFLRTDSPLLKTRSPISRISVVNVYDHDPRAFTQGLVYHQGHLYESTGLYGKSALMKKDLSSRKVLKAHQMPAEYFGEGIAILDGKIYQLTYQNETGFIYDLETFKITGQFSYRGEGWGLTTDGRYLMMSNGSSIITFHDPGTFKIIRRIQVKDGDTSIGRINEMAFVKGEIWANIFMEDVIVRISPQTGKVTGWIDLSPLYSYLPRNSQVDVLNGIAYDRQAERIFVTGKFWPKIFEIQLFQ
jgi:glutamine cyclotransferase